MSDRGTILVVDDDQMVLDTLHEMFIDDYDVVSADSGKKALEVIQKNEAIETVILDIKMADMNGLETADEINKLRLGLPIIFHTGFPGDYSEREIDNTYKPFDYIVKGEKPIRLYRSVKNSVRNYRLIRGGDSLVEKARNEYKIIGKSRLMQDIYRKIEQIGPSNGNVLITGPSGAGKELVASALHRVSKRADKPFIPFNCNYKNPDLVESALFGHIRGAFTNAYSDQVGIFEEADGGTIFLDEIGDMRLETQEKLLRTLDSGEISVLGGNMKIVDVRIFFATNKKMKALLDEGMIRDDFYYRIEGLEIELPALRERREDIPDLVSYFSEIYCQDSGIGAKVFSKEAITAMIDFDWPGNVRQLQKAVEAMIDMTPSHYIRKNDFEAYLKVQVDNEPNLSSYESQLVESKRKIILKALLNSDNNVREAARKLCIDRTTLYRKMKELDIE